MITNQRQYRISCALRDKFELAYSEILTRPQDNGVHPKLFKAEREALASQLADLRAEIEEYESLQSTYVSIISVDSIEELAEGLIKARISENLSQLELAERLGLKEQQIQRYESELYRSASYERLCDIATALGVRIRNDILMPVAPNSLQQLIDKLRQVGISREFLFSRILPSAEEPYFSGEIPSEDEEALTLKICLIINRVFGWTCHELFSSQPLHPPRKAVTQARFILPAWRAESTTVLYTAYANYLAVVVSNGSCKLLKNDISTDARKVRKEVIAQHCEFTLKTALHYVWDLGIPVLPLREYGAFHGACWRYDNRNIIVLKPNCRYEAKWIFDLFHQLYHAGCRPAFDTMEIIEADATFEETRNSIQSIAASQFAGDVVLDCRAEELAQVCVSAAAGSVERLKEEVPIIAKSENVGVGALANYMAFRLSLQNIDWWSAATNLQKEDNDPWITARDVFFERFPFEFDREFDREILFRALR